MYEMKQLTSLRKIHTFFKLKCRSLISPWQSKSILNSSILQICFKMTASANLGPERKEKGVARKFGVSEISGSRVVIY